MGNIKFYFTSGSLDQFGLQNIPRYARDILQAKLVSGTLCKKKLLKFPCKVVVNNYYKKL